MGSDSIMEFEFVPLKVKSLGLTGLSGVRDVMRRNCRICLWDGEQFVGNILNIATNQNRWSNSNWTFPKDAHVIVRCGDDCYYNDCLYLYVEFNTTYFTHDQDLQQAGLSKESGDDYAKQVVEITSCWSLIGLNSLLIYFKNIQNNKAFECTSGISKYHTFPLYAGDLKLPPTLQEDLLAVSQGKPNFFYQHFGQSGEFQVRLSPVQAAMSLTNARIETRDLPILCLLSHHMVAPVALYRQFLAQELAQAQKPLAKLTHPVLTCFPIIMNDDDLREAFLRQINAMCLKRLKFVGGYPTKDWLLPQFCNLVQQYWPLVQSESVTEKPIDNLKLQKDRRIQIITQYILEDKNNKEDVARDVMRKLCCDEEILRVLMVKPFDIKELDFCLANQLQSAE
eukprot:TRINITY_DN5608_c0_g1_i10.p1 TRINITY_DN5608_c0_g1~~TRINITY_DN5608_c0_g1_i10.p1  ORF type:complete len:395 (+),score=29.12 TRINITY_DN5608_c0_g1_i10:404-1588(+)